MEFVFPPYQVDYEVNKVNPYPLLSEGMRRVIDYQMEHAAGAFDTNCTWEELRERYVEERKYWNEGGPEAFRVAEMKVPDGPEGDVPVRIYYPDDKPEHPAVVFIHGGGGTVGSNDTHDRMMRGLMASSGCAVIGINYRLAPEYKFPVPLFEVAAVTRFFHEHGADYGILPDKMALCGDSGGASLAMSANLYLRDTPGGNAFICALLLYYGSYGLTDSASMRMNGSLLDGMRHADLETYYLFCVSPEDRDNPYYASLNNDLTKGIPATYLCCGDLDPLHDDSLVLSKILQNHGVRVKLEVLPGVIHAHMHYSRMMDEAVQCLRNSAAFLKSCHGDGT